MSKPLPQGTFEVPPPLINGSVAWQNDVEKKKQFGIELAKSPQDAFKAACEVFGKDTSAALWAVKNWSFDPVVIASKDLYRQVTEDQINLLDKTSLAVKLLKFSDEKSPDGRFYLHESKDRLAALKLYAEVQGFIGKVDISNSTNFNTNNEMKIIFVEAEKKELPELKSSPVIDSDEDRFEVLNDGIKLKLVG